MLDTNPATRSTANQVLNSPWITVWSVADADSPAELWWNLALEYKVFLMLIIDV